MPVWDAVIIGGGPAGATAGRLLTQWGHSVAILTAPAGRRPQLAECLPPSTRKLFGFLGILDEIDGAGFYRTTGNTVWWGGRRRVEPYPEGWGYQVLRSDFDGLLLSLARSAGARVEVGKAFGVVGAKGPGVEFQAGEQRARVRARFVLDCSGRARVLGRTFHVKQLTPKTIALCGIWRNEPNWRLPDETHTLVEAYGDGWAWSVPVSPFIRHAAFMVDPGETRMARGQGLGAAYLAELAKTRALRRIFGRGTLEAAPWGRDASLYSAKRYGGPGFLLVGDAGSFIDPLSSFGVKKAMVSAWVGAVVANTCLRRPEMQRAALEFFEAREVEVYADCCKLSASWFRKASGRFARPFWEQRAELADAPLQEEDADAARRALQELRRKAVLRLRRAAGVRVEQRPGIEGREIVMRDVLAGPGVARDLDFLESVNLPRLAELAEQHGQVPELYEAYNRVCPQVALPNFLTALAALVAKKILVDRAAAG